MKTQGIKELDARLQDQQLDWLVVPVRECPDAQAESHWVNRFFRIPHEPYGSNRSFVRPVCVRRTQRRVLFLQESGVNI